jgi:hypothetical protein
MTTAATFLKYSDPNKFRDDLLIQTGRGVVRFGDAMAPFQRNDFANLDSGFVTLACGGVPALRRYFITRTKGGSKDSDLAVEMLFLMAYAQRPVRIQIGAFDSDQADEIRLIVKQILGLDGPVNRLLASRIVVQTDGFLCKKTGVEATCLTSDHLGSHGARPDVLLLNELSHIRNKEFAETLMDNADKVPSSIVVIATNAGCIDSWQYEWRRIAVESPRWYFSELNEPAPWVSEADLAESRRRNPPSRFDRLWGGKWVRGSGDALDLQTIEQAVVLDGPAKRCEPDCIMAAGLDIGVRRDHSSICAVGYHRTSERFFLGECLAWTPTRGHEVDLQAVENAVVQLHAKFNLRVVGYDPSQAIHMAQRLNRRGVRMQEVPFVGRNLHTMAETLIELFNARAIDLYDDPALIRDLGRLSIAEKPYGFRLEAVADASGHADRATALAIALPILRDLVKNVSHNRSSGVIGMRVVGESSRHGVLLDRGPQYGRPRDMNGWTRANNN